MRETKKGREEGDREGEIMSERRNIERETGWRQRD